MDWFRKHTDKVIILGAFAAAILWMNAQFNEINSRFSAIEKDMAIIKTVLIMKQIMPSELAQAEEKQHIARQASDTNSHHFL